MKETLIERKNKVACTGAQQIALWVVEETVATMIEIKNEESRGPDIERPLPLERFNYKRAVFGNDNSSLVLS